MSIGLVSAAGSSGDPGDQIRSLFSAIETNQANLDFTDTWEPISNFLAQDHAGFFDDQADPTGKPWKPLSPPAVDSRWLRQLGAGGVGSGRFGKTRESEFLSLGFRPDTTILIDTGALRISLAYPGSPNHAETREPLQLDWGTNVDYAWDHQFGAIRQTYDERAERWKEIEIPPRPMVGWSEVSIDFTVNTVADAAVAKLLLGI